MMRLFSRISFLFVTSVLAAAACSRPQAVVSEPDSYRLAVTLEGVDATRADDSLAGEEQRVRDLQLFVFSDGAREDYLHITEGVTGSLICRYGMKSVWAVVNGSDLSDIFREDDLEGSVVPLGANARGALVMSGSVRVFVSEDIPVGIRVQRLVSRVEIQNIVTDFDGTRLGGKPFSLDAVYLINVPAATLLGGGWDPINWLNCLEYDSSAPGPLLRFEPEEGNIVENTPFLAFAVFYTNPNRIDDVSYDDEWCPRRTMLVLECTADGERGYYPVTLPRLERNCSYTIPLVKIQTYPSPVAWRPAEGVKVQAEVRIEDWTPPEAQEVEL